MTNKEAIAILTHNWKYRELIDNSYQYEALELAIKALEREETLEQDLSITEDNSAVGDLISRSELKNRKFLTPDAVEAKKWLPEYTKGYQQGWNEAIDAIVDNAPTVDTYIEDDVQYAIKESIQVGYEMAKAKFERPHGTWSYDYTNGFGNKIGHCSECDYLCEHYNFCPNCGADLRKEVDNEKSKFNCNS